MAIKGFNYWLEAALKGHNLSDNAESLIQEIEMLQDDDIKADRLFDLSIILELLGHPEALSIQKDALSIKDTYKWVAPVFRDTLKFQRKQYDALTGQPLMPDLELFVVKCEGTTLSNTPIECIVTDTIITSLYINQTPKLNNNNKNTEAIFVAVAPNETNSNLLSQLEFDLAHVEKFISNKPVNLKKLLPMNITKYLNRVDGIIYKQERVDSNINNEFHLYRVAMIAGELYPYSVGISDKFIHSYEEAEMQKQPKKLLLEKKLLNDFSHNLTPNQKVIFNSLYKELNLDYLIIDFIIQPDGMINIIDINTNNLIHTFHSGMSSYKFLFAEKIVDAFTDMLYFKGVGCE